MSIEKISKEIVKTIKQSDTKTTKAYDTVAEVIRIEDDICWVHIDGGVDETPVKKTINARVGDMVQVRVSGGRAFITGNITAPPTDDTIANQAKDIADIASQKGSEAKVTADVANLRALSALDKIKDIGGDTNQYVWHVENAEDLPEGVSTGTHITEIPKDDFIADPENGGGNLLARSNGIAIRDGLIEMAKFSTQGVQVGQDNSASVLISATKTSFLNTQGTLVGAINQTDISGQTIVGQNETFGMKQATQSIPISSEASSIKGRIKTSRVVEGERIPFIDEFELPARGSQDLSYGDSISWRQGELVFTTKEYERQRVTQVKDSAYNKDMPGTHKYFAFHDTDGYLPRQNLVVDIWFDIDGEKKRFYCPLIHWYDSSQVETIDIYGHVAQGRETYKLLDTPFEISLDKFTVEGKCKFSYDSMFDPKQSSYLGVVLTFRIYNNETGNEAPIPVVHSQIRFKDYKEVNMSLEYTTVTYEPTYAFGTSYGLKGGYSFTAGEGLLAQNNRQIALGKFNEQQSNTILELGNGADNENRSNAMTVDTDGIISARNPNNDFDTIFNLIYPVGSIYMSVNDVDPSKLFGGTWEKLKDRFLLSSGDTYKKDGTGGAASVKYTPAGSTASIKLTAAQSGLKGHKHDFTNPTISGGSHSHAPTTWNSAEMQFLTVTSTNASTGRSKVTKGSTTDNSYIYSATVVGRATNTKSATPSMTASGGVVKDIAGSAATDGHNHAFTGTEATLNNMPPYLVVNMWKRTA